MAVMRFRAGFAALVAMIESVAPGANAVPFEMVTADGEASYLIYTVFALLAGFPIIKEVRSKRAGSNSVSVTPTVTFPIEAANRDAPIRSEPIIMVFIIFISDLMTNKSSQEHRPANLTPERF